MPGIKLENTAEECLDPSLNRLSPVQLRHHRPLGSVAVQVRLQSCESSDSDSSATLRPKT